MNILKKKDYESILDFKGNQGVPITTRLLSKVLIKVFSLLGKKAKNYLHHDSDYIEKEGRAINIINNPKIKGMLCPAFRKEVSSKLSAGEKQAQIIKILTTLLTRDEIIEKFSIEKNVRLFSVITIVIWRQGIESYCAKGLKEFKMI